MSDMELFEMMKQMVSVQRTVLEIVEKGNKQTDSVITVLRTLIDVTNSIHDRLIELEKKS